MSKVLLNKLPSLWQRESLASDTSVSRIGISSRPTTKLRWISLSLITFLVWILDLTRSLALL